jgi:HAD superfamily hydrolase (TIGR01509 family)
MYKEIFINKKVIIFDLDGTLVDSGRYWTNAVEDVLKKIGVSSDLAVYGNGAYIGERIKNIIDHEGNPSRLPLDELIKHANEAFISQIEKADDFDVRLGFFEFVLALRERSKNLVLASNTDKYVVEKMIKMLGIESMFDYVITGDMVKKRKPDPEIYESVAKHFGVAHKQCLVFEDSIPGIEAAKRAKMDTIAIYDPAWDINPQTYPDTVLFYESDFSTLPHNLDTTPMEAAQAADVQARENEKLYGQLPPVVEDII